MKNWIGSERKWSWLSLKIVFQNLPGGTEKDNDKLQSGYSMTFSRFEMDAS
jgi:hypothetical protein